MRLLGGKPASGGPGSVHLLPQGAEDLWHAYNLIAPGDEVRSVSYRKVQKESNTGSSTSEKIKLNVTVKVEKIDFDPQDLSLRLKGRNVADNRFIKLGQYHTLELSLQRDFWLHKHNWDSVYLDRIDQACDVRALAEIAAVVMEQGIAHVCLITPFMTRLMAKVELSIPRKRPGNQDQRTKKLHQFYNNLIEAIRRQIDFEVVKCVIVASPSFFKDDFLKYMLEEAAKGDMKTITGNKHKFLAVHSSSGYLHEIDAIMKDKAVQAQIADTKAFQDVAAMENFIRMLAVDFDRVTFGLNHVEAALDRGAVEQLLITDELFRSSVVSERQRYVRLVEQVKASGGQVFVFSRMHQSGERLAGMTGVAAILRYAIPDLADPEEEKAQQAKLEQKRGQLAALRLAHEQQLADGGVPSPHLLSPSRGGAGRYVYELDDSSDDADSSEDEAEHH